MKINFLFSFLAYIAISLLSVINCPAQKTVKIQFDSNKEVSGRKFAIKDITPGLPSNWDGYNFVVLEFKSTTPQRFQVGFTTETGYNELRIMSYCANGWNKLAIPLRFYRALPDAAQDLAATFNQARYTGWINLGGKRGPLRGVDSIGIRMNAPINNPVIELRSIALSVEDPGDQYLGSKPVVDEFGQWNLGDFEGKIKSAGQLRKEWDAEEAEVVTTKEFNYSRFGGYLPVKVKATGFFRTEKIDGRWWFVDPDGYLFLSVGVDCVSPGGGGNVLNLDKRRNLYKELPPAGIAANPDRPGSISFGAWNLFKRYGDAYPVKSREMVVKRMDKWGLNTICNWSSPEVTKLNRKAFMTQLHGLGIESGLMGLPDVYAPDFSAKVDAAIKDFVTPYRENPWLIGYFTGNEPSWLGQEERLCGLILDGTGLPMIIGEYHFGTVDRGMAQSLWQVNSQKERGVAYSFYTEQAYSHPGLIGTAYFQWCDQDLTGRRDGENYNCGLIDVTDRPYPLQVGAMMETAKRLFDIHNGKLKPTDAKPVKARGHGSIPDLWEK